MSSRALDDLAYANANVDALSAKVRRLADAEKVMLALGEELERRIMESGEPRYSSPALVDLDHYKALHLGPNNPGG